MAILMNSGKTGSGKTFNAVKAVHKDWRLGRDVWSNTPLFFSDFNKGHSGENIVHNPEYFTLIEKYVINISLKIVSKLFKKEYEPLRRGKINYFDTIDEIFHVKDATIFFDEGQTLFRNYDWEFVPRLFLYKIEQNRKHGLDLVTTAQRVKAVNINYRELIQDWGHYETKFDLLGFHVYRERIKDTDFITENMQHNEIPDIKTKMKIITPFTKRLYDTFYDIGFEPLQQYDLEIKGQKVVLICETGLKVKEVLAQIRLLTNFQKL